MEAAWASRRVSVADSTGSVSKPVMHPQVTKESAGFAFPDMYLLASVFIIHAAHPAEHRSQLPLAMSDSDAGLDNKSLSKLACVQRSLMAF